VSRTRTHGPATAGPEERDLTAEAGADTWPRILRQSSTSSGAWQLRAPRIHRFHAITGFAWYPARPTNGVQWHGDACSSNCAKLDASRRLAIDHCTVAFRFLFCITEAVRSVGAASHERESSPGARGRRNTMAGDLCGGVRTSISSTVPTIPCIRQLASYPVPRVLGTDRHDR